VREATDLGAQEVLQGRVERRTGLTIYTRMGDGPVVAVAAVALALAWALTLREARAGRREDGDSSDEPEPVATGVPA
jgi:apolipoprotein N-acyltransferase